MSKQVRILLVVGLTSFLGSVLCFYAFERPGNPQVRNLFDAIWWWVVTSGTVGYGDIVPVTWQGRCVAMFAILSGVYIYTNLIAIIAQQVQHLLERRERGLVSLQLTNHLVFCEYTAVADELIHWLPQWEGAKHRPLVIVSDLVPTNPYPQHHFVFGVPINPAVLQRASIATAAYVFVFANLRFTDPDIKSLHVAARILRINPNARIFVELVNPDHDVLGDVSPGIIPVSSQSLVRCIMRHERMDPDVWLQQAGLPPAAPGA